MGIECFLLRSLVDELMDTRAIPVKHSKDTADVTKDLLELILASGGSPDPDKLLSKKHFLFLSVIEAGKSSEDKVGTLTDQVLIARSLSAGAKWCKASQVRSISSQDQWCFRSVVANCCCLLMHGCINYVASESAAMDPHLTSQGTGEDAESDGDNSDKAQDSSKCGTLSKSTATLGEESADEYSDDSDEGSDDRDRDSDSPNSVGSFDPHCITDWDIQTALDRLRERLEMPSDNMILNHSAADLPPTLNEYVSNF